MKFFEKYIPGNRKINMSLIWDYDIKNKKPIDFKNIIITRTIEMGRMEDFYAAFDLVGGINNFKTIVKKEIYGLNNKNLNFICSSLDIKKEDTLCYKKQQLRKKHLNS